MENFRHVFDGSFRGLFFDRMEQNHDLCSELMSDPAKRDLVAQRLRQDVYERIVTDQPHL